MAQPHVWPLALADARYVPIWEYTVVWGVCCGEERGARGREGEAAHDRTFVYKYLRAQKSVPAVHSMSYT